MLYNMRRIKKEVDVLLIEREREAEIQVKFRVVGIPSDDLARIFEKFYREPGAIHLNPQDVGIVWEIVKYIMDAQGGNK